MKTALVILARGFEEIEAVTPADLLRRAGVEVVLAGVGGLEITGAHGLTVTADIVLEEYAGLPDGVIIPGGMPGAANIAASPAAMELIRRVFESGGLTAAICAAPGVVLGGTAITRGRQVTCYPGYEKYLPPEAVFTEDPVAADGNLITSRGPGTAFLFSLALVDYLAGKAAAGKIAADTLWDRVTG